MHLTERGEITIGVRREDINEIGGCTYFAMLRVTKTSPGLQAMTTLSGTRESAQPIQRTWGRRSGLVSAGASEIASGSGGQGREFALGAGTRGPCSPVDSFPPVFDPS